MSVILLIIILLTCLVLEGFFSGSETAVVCSNKLKLALETDAGCKRARSVLHLVKHPAVFFSTTLFGTNLTTVTGSVVSTLFIIERYGQAYAPLALLYWPFTMIFGEIVPKSIYQHYADRIVLRIAPLLVGASYALYPAVWFFSKLTDMLLGGVKKRSATDAPISRDELEVILKVGRPEASDVRPTERTLISRLFDLADKRVEQIMTSLVNVVSIPITTGRAEAERILDENGYSRVPVFEGRAFNIVGVLAGMDLLFGEPEKSVGELMRPAYFVSEEMPLDELLISMKREGRGLAVAVDEYGAATGIVTIEDLMEEVIGEIADEHDETVQLFARLGRHRYLLQGRLEIAHANERLHLGIPDGPYQTVAGFIIHRIERIPRPGETLREGRTIYRVVKATDRAILEIEASRTAEKGEGGI